MAKIYRFKKDGTWHGNYELSEILYIGLPEDTLIWWEGLCPNNNPPESCTHCIKLAKLKDYNVQPHITPQPKRTEKPAQPTQVAEPATNATSSRNLSYLLAFALFAIIALYPYIFDTSNGQEKKKEKIDQQIKIDIQKLSVELRSTKETEYYEVKKVFNPEIIKDNKGDYFIVDLKKIQKKERVLFQPGEYIIDDLNQDFINSLGKFMDDVYSKLDKGVECRLFVRGSADIAGHSTFKKAIDSRFGESEGFTRIEYLKSIENSKSSFSQEKAIQNIGSEYTNNELPNLRGKFIQYKISQSFKDIKPIILEGAVEGVTDEKLRNAYLFLYVNWEKKKYLD